MRRPLRVALLVLCSTPLLGSTCSVAVSSNTGGFHCAKGEIETDDGCRKRKDGEAPDSELPGELPERGTRMIALLATEEQGRPAAAIPEPTAGLLYGVGLVVLVAWRRRSRTRA